MIESSNVFTQPLHYELSNSIISGLKSNLILCTMCRYPRALMNFILHSVCLSIFSTCRQNLSENFLHIFTPNLTSFVIFVIQVAVMETRWSRHQSLRSEKVLDEIKDDTDSELCEISNYDVDFNIGVTDTDDTHVAVHNVYRKHIM